MRLQNSKFALPHNISKPATNPNLNHNLKQKLGDANSFKSLRSGLMGPSSIPDDCMSVNSDTTIIQQGLSQEEINTFRNHLSDTLKLLVTTAEENTEKLVNALTVRHQDNTSVLMNSIQEIGTEVKATHNNFNELQKSLVEEVNQELAELKSVMDQQNEKLLDSLSIALRALELRGQNKKKRKVVHKKLNYYHYLGPVAKKKPVLPCDCLLNAGNFKTRKQLMEAYRAGKIKCKC